MGNGGQRSLTGLGHLPWAAYCGLPFVSVAIGCRARAQRPTAFVLYGPQKQEQAPYRFEYWVPKADLNLRLKRLVTLSRADRLTFRSDLVAEDPTVFKRRLWTRAPEERLLQYLRTIPPMGSFIQEFKAFKQSKVEFNRNEHWVIGQGFKPAQESRLSDLKYQTTIVEIVTQLAFYCGWPKAWSTFPMLAEVWPDEE